MGAQVLNSGRNKRMADHSVDLLVVGGGVMGLWAARRGVEAGLSTLLVTEGVIGRSGGSAQPLGALMPHAPERWAALAAFQFAALAELEAEIRRLEAETGRDVGYARVGRLAPLATADTAAAAEMAAAAAALRWRAEDGRRFALRRRPRAADDPLADAAPYGVREDDLTARLAPRAYLAALAASLEPAAQIRESARFVGWDGAARFSDGASVACGALVIAAGVGAFPLLSALGDAPGEALGVGVKGQAAIFEPPPETRERLVGAPLLYDRGLYVVPHQDGSVGVGATTEPVWDDADRPDAGAAELARRAQALCPALDGLKPARFWAGLRPRTRGRGLCLGAVDGPLGAPLWALTGGYKISFGVAHRAAAALIGRIADLSDAPLTPAEFAPETALAPRRRRR